MEYRHDSMSVTIRSMPASTAWNVKRRSRDKTESAGPGYVGYKKSAEASVVRKVEKNRFLSNHACALLETVGAPSLLALPLWLRVREMASSAMRTSFSRLARETPR